MIPHLVELVLIVCVERYSRRLVIMGYTRDDIIKHVEKYSLPKDDRYLLWTVGWHGDLYMAPSKEKLVDILCTKEGIKNG